VVSSLINEFPNTFAVVEYHQQDSWSTPWGDARGNFYNIWGDGIPWFAYDGLFDAWPIDTYRSKFIAEQAVSTDVTIQVGGELVSGTTYRIRAKIALESTGTAKTMRIYMVQVLDALWGALPSYSRNTFRQAAATSDISLTPGHSAIVTKDFTFASSPDMANQAKIRMIVWAQAPLAAAPAQVYQAKQMGWPFAPLAHPLGDMDGDYDVDLGDIPAYALALVNRTAYNAQYPSLNADVIGDMNQNGVFNGADTQGFVNVLINGM
jgi:hypothetical protein